MNYIAYYRVSTKYQEDSGLGLKAQQADVQRFLKKKDTIISEYTEIESGRNCERQKLKEAIGLAIRTDSTLLVAKLDRLSRDATFTLQLRKSGVKFIAVDMPEANDLTIGIMSLLAEDEAKRTSARTKASLKVIKETIARDGFYISKAGNKITKLGNDNLTPEARKKSGQLRREKSKTDDSRRAYHFIKSYKDQNYTLKQIAEKLNEAGFLTPNGGKFYPIQVSREIKKFEE